MLECPYAVGLAAQQKGDIMTSDNRINRNDGFDNIVDNATVRCMMIEAGEHGDCKMVETCQRALDGDHGARARVAKAIADARAMDDT